MIENFSQINGRQKTTNLKAQRTPRGKLPKTKNNEKNVYLNRKKILIKEKKDKNYIKFIFGKHTRKMKV